MSKLKILRFFTSFLSYQHPTIVSDVTRFVIMVLFALYCDSVRSTYNEEINDKYVAHFIHNLDYSVHDIYDNIVKDAPKPDEGYQE